MEKRVRLFVINQYEKDPDTNEELLSENKMATKIEIIDMEKISISENAKECIEEH